MGAMMRSRSYLTSRTYRRAFTLVELLVSIGIFALMTALVVAKYGSFNQNIFLTNLAYDVALTIRTAQTYGLSVKSASDSSSEYRYAYGVNINTDAATPTCAGAVSNNKQFVLFADADASKRCSSDVTDILISAYSIKRGAYISQVCAGSSSSCTLGTGYLNISFKRPDPRAIICLNTTCDASYSYAEIQLKSAEGGTRRVVVQSNGQITVKD